MVSRLLVLILFSVKVLQTCKCGIRLAEVFTAPGSKSSLHNLLRDSHHQDPRHLLYENIPDPGGHPVSAGFPAITFIVEDRESSATDILSRPVVKVEHYCGQTHTDGYQYHGE